ncbi:MAG: CYTH domain-containing protein [Candidatus Pacebacteria bacterium]|nr:CYTH domain-containing protein [Candidatus Paceibacterota bacterium]
MDKDYFEDEVKVLDVSPEHLKRVFAKIKAKKVFDDKRLFTSFDYPNLKLTKNGKGVRLTEEGKLKLSFTTKLSTKSKETIKLFVSRKKEAVDFLDRLGLKPIAECPSHRISWEWKGVDFDLDQFPQIPPFLEIDPGDSGIALKKILELLDLGNREVVTLSTREVYTKYGKDYLKLFAIK